uniref:Adenylyl-sulfate kinase n=1 Tax=Polytomella parva TaxID=51329 RepID=A0A7S0UPB1_9CHLO|mmetsp:Transcript_12992/g.23106  ORF Transcript_12992/g.23106 Transcript_12992/m.23106 type:complete len:245 (+) Transcript_12992:80-814(+)
MLQVSRSLRSTLRCCSGVEKVFFVSQYSSVKDVGLSTNIKWHEGAVSTETKENNLNQKGCIVWFTGLSGSGKSTVACTLEHALADIGKATALLDGDNIRHGLNNNLGFSAADRMENIRRIGEVSKLFSENGIITLVSFISPYKNDRDKVRKAAGPGKFIEVFMKVPIAICEERDPKGLYKKARAGLLKGFTGIDDPYEEPEAPELTLEAVKPNGERARPEEQAMEILAYLENNGYLKGNSIKKC